MADTYEKDLAQKSSLTTSDFIRVVGSDNVSYKQLVSGVMTAMGLDAIKTPASEVSNIDTATSTGFYKYGSGASGTKPNSSGGVLIVVAFNASYSQQVAIPYDTNNSSGVYKRAVYSGTPTAWQLQPTRAEVDALNSKSSLALTYTSNNYVTSASLNLCAATKIGNVLLLKINITVDNFPSGAAYDNTEIGRISNWSASSATNICLSPQNGVDSSGILFCAISASGVITISNRSGKACNGFYRATAVSG